MFTCFNAHKTNQFSHTFPVLQLCIPPQSETLCFNSPPPLMNNSALIGQLTHTRPSIANNNRAVVLNQFLRVEQAASRNYANSWHDDSVWCHIVTELKARLLTRRFRSRVFCGREELLLLRTLTIFTFKTLDDYKTEGEGKMKEDSRSPFNVLIFDGRTAVTLLKLAGIFVNGMKNFLG